MCAWLSGVHSTAVCVALPLSRLLILAPHSRGHSVFVHLLPLPKAPLTIKWSLQLHLAMQELCFLAWRAWKASYPDCHGAYFLEVDSRLTDTLPQLQNLLSSGYAGFWSSLSPARFCSCIGNSSLVVSIFKGIFRYSLVWWKLVSRTAVLKAIPLCPKGSPFTPAVMIWSHDWEVVKAQKVGPGWKEESLGCDLGTHLSLSLIPGCYEVSSSHPFPAFCHDVLTCHEMKSHGPNAWNIRRQNGSSVLYLLIPGICHRKHKQQTQNIAIKK